MENVHPETFFPRDLCPRDFFSRDFFPEMFVPGGLFSKDGFPKFPKNMIDNRVKIVFYKKTMSNFFEQELMLV